MSEVHVIKTPQGWSPADDESREVHKRQKLGAYCSAEFKQIRNYKFLQKFFCLLRLTFDYWETGDAEYNGQKVQKNFERFREDVQILAGYGEPVWNVRGEMRMRSQSISFGKMDEETFNKLYQSVLTVLLNRVMRKKGFTRETIETTVNQLLEFA